MIFWKYREIKYTGNLIHNNDPQKGNTREIQVFNESIRSKRDFGQTEQNKFC